MRHLWPLPRPHRVQPWPRIFLALSSTSASASWYLALHFAGLINIRAYHHRIIGNDNVRATLTKQTSATGKLQGLCSLPRIMKIRMRTIKSSKPTLHAKSLTYGIFTFKFNLQRNRRITQLLYHSIGYMNVAAICVVVTVSMFYFSVLPSSLLLNCGQISVTVI